MSAQYLSLPYTLNDRYVTATSVIKRSWLFSFWDRLLMMVLNFLCKDDLEFILLYPQVYFPWEVKLNCWKKVPLLSQYRGLNTEPHACLSRRATTIKLYSKPLGNYIKCQGSLKDEPQNPNGRHEELLKISSPKFLKIVWCLFSYIWIWVTTHWMYGYVQTAVPTCGWKPDVYK